MYAECARQSCAQQASVLLAFDPRGARAWLRDLLEANPAMGLMLCPDHAETTTVPVSWSLVDERSVDLDDQMEEQVDGPPPSFDDIFPPRAAREPDPYGLDPDLDLEPRLDTSARSTFDEHASSESESSWDVEDHSPDSDYTSTTDYASNTDYTSSTVPGFEPDDEARDAAEWLAPELPASGTDGAPVRQPQLPMISAPTRETTDNRGNSRYGDAADRSVAPGDFLFTEGPEDRFAHGIDAADGIDVADGIDAAHGTDAAHGIGTSASSSFSSGTPLSGTASAAPSISAAPLFENMARTPRLAPPTSPLLSRAFRTAQLD